ncbi:MAG: hypothetical protein OEY93_12925, partial [Anaerolineae bacterium]|nr:hypothetical protein [Anaerolineae bacterium]
QWDLYLLDLNSGKVMQLTNDLAYDGSPAWSSDGSWIAYEKYVDNNLDIFIQLANGGEAVQVTSDPASDTSPAWKPGENTLAFTSNRSLVNDIWVIEIDRIGFKDGLTQYTNNPTLDQSRPSWSPDGKYLGWIQPFHGFESIYISDISIGETSAKYIGGGSQVVWSPGGDKIATSIPASDSEFFAAYDLISNTYLTPPIAFPGNVSGISWTSQTFTHFPAPIQKFAEVTQEAPWKTGLTPAPGAFFGRQFTIPLSDIKAPNPALSALVVEAFYALRDRIDQETGWDVLSDLENAYIPLTQPLPPGRGNDWLFTGRAIAINSVLIELEWMRVVREDIGGQIYWRVFIKAREQDGSHGKPMTQIPWNFRARFSGSTTSYEEGGAPDHGISPGYWVDITNLANIYGWERLPALSNWTSYYPGARFNVFVITNGMDWESAMLQLYPPEIFLQP